MATSLATSIIDLILGLTLSPAGQDAPNRVTLDGLAVAPKDDGALEIRIEKLAAASLRVACGPLALEIGELALRELVALVRIEEGRPRLGPLDVASAELSGVKAEGPMTLPPQAKAVLHAAHAPASWCLGPLAAADGTVRAEIVDAHLLFDADVTVKIRQGQVDFNDATVEHVGPDSRMGVSRLGLYVDAPNGRSYLYQFSSAPVAGVQYERRGALLGPWVTDRGKLQLQAFGESLLRQSRGGGFLGITEQARLLFDRTAVDGDVQLSDGRFAVPGLQGRLAGRADGRNVVRVHSEAVGRELTVEVASLSVREAVASAGATQMACDEVAGALKLRFFVEGGQLRFALDLEEVKIGGLRLPSKLGSDPN